MSMEVDVHEQILVQFCTLNDKFLCCPDGRVFSFTGVHVESIQVVAFSIEPVIASRHTVRIKHRYNLEHKVLSQATSLLIFKTEK